MPCEGTSATTVGRFLLKCFTVMEKANHSSILAWKIPWVGEPGRLQSMVSLRVGHNTCELTLMSQYWDLVMSLTDPK